MMDHPEVSLLEEMARLHSARRRVCAELREALGAYDRAENAALRADAAVRVALWARTLLDADEL